MEKIILKRSRNVMKEGERKLDREYYAEKERNEGSGKVRGEFLKNCTSWRRELLEECK